jgi:phosphomannomutase/phosphoglucomutase
MNLPNTFPRPVPALHANGAALETLPLVKPTGFREYDARWWYGRPGSDVAPELNLLGVTALGLGLGTYLHERAAGPDIVTGHDFRSYSAAIKLALSTGLVAAGCRVHDLGLAITPIAYFAQFDLDVPSVAMVTASHNENGWTGVKMGCERPLTFGPEEMNRLKEIVLSGEFRFRDGGSWRYHAGYAERYIAALVDRPKLTRPLKVVVATGNGTAGAFAPHVLETIGCEVVPLHTELDNTFPNYNPNPEDLAMLHDVAAAVIDSKADLGLAFDGDGDRCGVVDNFGREIFADKIGVLLARDLAAHHANALFVVDVKSTGLFATDPVLKKLRATTDYWKTGHSHIKRRVSELGALAGFEKSGHFFFNAPLGHGYDDALLTALSVCDMLERNPGQSIAALYDGLPKTWGTPTMSAHCPDEVKYEVADRVTQRIDAMATAGDRLGGHAIVDQVTVNGIRVVTDDGSWALVRASSNKPELVVVVESPLSEARMRETFAAIDTILRENPEVGDYNQTI